jgi:hypothetical protein
MTPRSAPAEAGPQAEGDGPPPQGPPIRPAVLAPNRRLLEQN